MSGIGLNLLNNNYSNYSQAQAPKQDPDAYAQQYADKNNLSLEEAKAELKTKHGDPTQGAQIPGLNADNTSIFTQANSTSSTSSAASDAISTPGSSNSIISKLMDFFSGGNISSQDIMNKDPDDLAQQYADENNISLEEAKKALSSQFGDPEQR